jgi:hypothetical protein
MVIEMQYFDTLPKIIHTNNNGISTIMTNLMARVSILPEILKNPMVYYKYDIQDGDTPEIVAYKYYDDPYRYWIVLFANKMLDPQWDWPLNSIQFNEYVNDKYGNTLNNLHHYEKVITKTTRGTDDDQTVTESFIISTEEFLGVGLVKTIELNERRLANGLSTTANTKSYLDITIQSTSITNYEYEMNLNESKRNINILNSKYVDQLETEFQDLMS